MFFTNQDTAYVFRVSSTEGEAASYPDANRVVHQIFLHLMQKYPKASYRKPGRLTRYKRFNHCLGFFFNA